MPRKNNPNRRLLDIEQKYTNKMIKRLTRELIKPNDTTSTKKDRK